MSFKSGRTLNLLGPMDSVAQPSARGVHDQECRHQAPLRRLRLRPVNRLGQEIHSHYPAASLGENEGVVASPATGVQERPGDPLGHVEDRLGAACPSPSEAGRRTDSRSCCGRGRAGSASRSNALEPNFTQRIGSSSRPTVRGSEACVEMIGALSQRIWTLTRLPRSGKMAHYDTQEAGLPGSRTHDVHRKSR